MGFTWKNRRLTFETNLRFFFDFGRTTGQTPGVRHGGELFTRIFRASRQFEGNEKQKRKSIPSDRPRLRRRRHRRKSRAPSAIRRDDLERKFSIKISSKYISQELQSLPNRAMIGKTILARYAAGQPLPAHRMVNSNRLMPGKERVRL